MTLNVFLKDIQFWLNSGIHHFFQNEPQSHYYINNKKEEDQNSKIPEKISDIQTLNELEQYIRNSNICPLKKNATQTVSPFALIAYLSPSNPLNIELVSVGNCMS